ncbi:hypothetical protein SEA_KLEIN_211 [Mycobacterium phage Klein]|nr:hypothetical protein SEA_KLEIN_211 [Mycobacterium phage Klein]
MRYTEAIEEHIRQQYADHVESAKRMGWEVYSLEYFMSKEYRGESGQFDIAREVATRVAKEMGELVTFGVFDNCRENGITVTSAGGWTFCVYEHRNSDNICIEGCPTSKVQPYGPYGGTDKWDTLYATEWKNYDGAAAAMVALLKATVELKSFGRRELKHIAHDAESRA